MIETKSDGTVKTDSNGVAVVDDTVNKPNSMYLYYDALDKVKTAVDIFESQNEDIAKLKKRINRLETVIMGVGYISNLQGRVDWLNNIYDAMDTSEVTSLLEKIEENSKRVQTILKGDEHIRLPYDASMILEGDNIELTKSGSVTKISAGRRYNVNTPETSGSNFIVTLKPERNLVVITLSGLSTSGYSNIIISNGESEDLCEWEVGQSVRFHIKDDLSSTSEFVGFNIVIGENTFKIDYSDIKGKSTIEIICVGEDKFISLIN